MIALSGVQNVHETKAEVLCANLIFLSLLLMCFFVHETFIVIILICLKKFALSLLPPLPFLLLLLLLHYPWRLSFSLVLLYPSMSPINSSHLSYCRSLHLSIALGLPLGYFWCKLAWYIFLVFLASAVCCRCPIRPKCCCRFAHTLYIKMAPINMGETKKSFSHIYWCHLSSSGSIHTNIFKT